MTWQPSVEQRPHPFGEAGVRSSLEEVCKRAAKGASDILGNGEHLARVRTWAIERLDRAKKRGERVVTPGDRARVLLHAVQHEKIWVPDPIGIEYVPAAHLMACDGPTHKDGTPCVKGDDCDGKIVFLAACFMAVGLYTMVVGHAYDSKGTISHVLTKVYFDGKWHYADASPLSSGRYMPLGECHPFTRERYYSMPEIKVVCDAASCDARSFDPDELGFVTKGTFVGVNGVPVVELPPEAVVRWLGEVRWLEATPVPKQCEAIPHSLDKDTLTEYADQCGAELALAWVKSKTGVDVSGCSGKGSRGAAECVANNYGGTIDLISSDGEVHWDHVVQDVGVVGGVAACAALGLGAAAPICGKIGAQVAQVLYGLASDVGGAVIDFFWGSKPGGWACGAQPFNGVPLVQMSRDVANYVRVAKTLGKYPLDALLGPPIEGTLPVKTTVSNLTGMRYWSRVLALRGVASVTGAIAADLARKTGLSPADAVRVLAPDAPVGWTELVNPRLAPTSSGSVGGTAATPDYLGNVGGLLTVMTEPNLSPMFAGKSPEIITPRWMKSVFWQGVEPTNPANALWRYFMCVAGCPTDSVVWGDVGDFAKAKKVLATPAGAKGHDQHQSYVVYSVPKSVEVLVTGTSDGDFAAVLGDWKKSISTGLEEKIKRGKSLATKKKGGGAGLKVAASVAVAAVVAWWVLA